MKSTLLRGLTCTKAKYSYVLLSLHPLDLPVLPPEAMYIRGRLEVMRCMSRS